MKCNQNLLIQLNWHNHLKKCLISNRCLKYVCGKCRHVIFVTRWFLLLLHSIFKASQKAAHTSENHFECASLANRALSYCRVEWNLISVNNVKCLYRLVIVGAFPDRPFSSCGPLRRCHSFFLILEPHSLLFASFRPLYSKQSVYVCVVAFACVYISVQCAYKSSIAKSAR